MAVSVAITLLMEKKLIEYFYPAVEAGEKLGFLPGDMKEKVGPILDRSMMLSMNYLELIKLIKK